MVESGDATNSEEAISDGGRQGMVTEGVEKGVGLVGDGEGKFLDTSGIAAHRCPAKDTGVAFDLHVVGEGEGDGGGVQRAVVEGDEEAFPAYPLQAQRGDVVVEGGECGLEGNAVGGAAEGDIIHDGDDFHVGPSSQFCRYDGVDKAEAEE